MPNDGAPDILPVSEKLTNFLDSARNIIIVVCFYYVISSGTESALIGCRINFIDYIEVHGSQSSSPHKPDTRRNIMKSLKLLPILLLGLTWLPSAQATDVPSNLIVTGRPFMTVSVSFTSFFT